MQRLEEETAIAMMGILFMSTDEEFKNHLKAALKTAAESKKGLFAMCSAWQGTELPADMREALHETFGMEFLYERNVVSICGTWIELNVLCGAMPDEFLNNFFHFDIRERAEKEGLTVLEVEDFIRNSYRGIDDDGDYLFDFENDKNAFRYLAVLGVSGFGGDGKYKKVYADMSTFGVENIRNILFRNTQGEGHDSGTQET
jgi:hypothetical protein